MHPYDQKVLEDAKQRERAYAYNTALRHLTTIERSAAKMEAEVEKFSEQLELFREIDLLAKQVSKNIQGPGSFLVRDQILTQVAAGREDQQRRLDRTQECLATLNRELPRMKADVAKFDAPTKRATKSA